MRNLEQIQRYFDGRARGYRRSFSRGVLGRLRRAERDALFRLLEPTAGDRILDAASGPGLDSSRLVALGCRVRAVDLSPNMVAEARRTGVEAEVGDLHELDLGETFEKVLCAGGLEFCHDPERVIERLCRHVAPGGRLVLLFPLHNVAGRVYAAYHRIFGVRIELFTPGRIRRAVTAAGCEPGELLRPLPFSAAFRADRGED